MSSQQKTETRESMEYKLRSRIADRIQDYLETVCCFRDYELRNTADFWNRNTEDKTIKHIYQPTKSALDQAIAEFAGRYSTIMIYV